MRDSPAPRDVNARSAWRYALPAFAFAALLVLLAAGLRLDPREVPSPLIGKPVPDFTLATLNDPQRQVRRDDLLGRAWLLNVWASWCAPCREEHPHLVDLARTARVPVYGLNYKDQRADAQAWLARLGDPYAASLFDGDGRVGLDFGVYGVPETFVIDRHGRVRYKHVGALTPQIIRERIVPLLGEIDG